MPLHSGLVKAGGRDRRGLAANGSEAFAFEPNGGAAAVRPPSSREPSRAKPSCCRGLLLFAPPQPASAELAATAAASGFVPASPLRIPSRTRGATACGPARHRASGGPRRPARRRRRLRALPSRPPGGSAGSAASARRARAVPGEEGEQRRRRRGRARPPPPPPNTIGGSGTKMSNRVLCREASHAGSWYTASGTGDAARSTAGGREEGWGGAGAESALSAAGATAGTGRGEGPPAPPPPARPAHGGAGRGLVSRWGFRQAGGAGRAGEGVPPGLRWSELSAPACRRYRYSSPHLLAQQRRLSPGSSA